MKEILVMLLTSISFVYNDDICKNNTGVNGHYTIFYTNGIETKEYIGLCNTETFHKEKNRIILHELGHFYFDKHISEEDKQEFIKLHEKSEKSSGTLKKRGFLSMQSSYNIDEDFAESFAHAYLGKSKDNAKVKFIKKILKK